MRCLWHERGRWQKIRCLPFAWLPMQPTLWLYEPTVFEVNEFEQAKGKVKENYLDIVATKQQDENRTKIKDYDADVETKMCQLLSYNL